MGCGRIAERHLLAYKKMPGVELILGDANPEAAIKLGHEQEVEFVRDPAELYKRDLDAIDVCVPTKWHTERVLEALDSGKHVFCEKPLCTTLEDGRKIDDAARRAKRIVMVGHLYRFHPAFQFVKEVLNDGIIGTPYFAIFRLGGRGSHVLWKHQTESGGGAMLEMLVHVLDLVCWYFGQPDKISLVVREQLLNKREIAGREREVSAEDLVLLKLSAGGAEVLCESDLLTPSYMNTVEIHGDNGSVFTSILHFLPTIVFCRKEKGVFLQGNNFRNFPQENLFERELGHFIGALRNGGPKTNSIDDSLKLLDVLDKIRGASLL